MVFSSDSCVFCFFLLFDVFYVYSLDGCVLRVRNVDMGINYAHNLVMGKIPCFNVFLSHNVGTIRLFFWVF